MGQGFGLRVVMLVTAIFAAASTVRAQVPDYRSVATGGPASVPASMAYDPVMSVPMLMTDSLYRWNGTGWTLASNTLVPLNGGIVTDPLRQRVVYIGTTALSSSLIQFYEWSGTSWSDRTPPTWNNGGPAPMLVSVAGYGVIAIVAWPTDVYLYDGNADTANPLAIGGISPTFVLDTATYDSGRGVVVFAGHTSIDAFTVYEFAPGGNASQRSVSGEPPDAGGRLVYDATRGVSVLLGRTFSSGTYEWNGVSWTNRSTSTQPAARSARPGAMYDPSGTRLLMYGGSSTDGQTWEYRNFLALGTTCMMGSQCGSGFCVDGVCCNSACGGSSTDCLACSIAAGGSVNGTCRNADPTHVCRPAAGACDEAESCSGSSATCPADVKSSSGLACRPAAGACDTTEYCNGVSVSCPADVLLPSSSVCRGLAGPCDAVENCTGSSAACPADAFTSGGTCRGAAGDCDASETCDGTSAQCPPDVLLPTGQICRNPSGPCDITDRCTGSSPLCDNLTVSDGTACDDGLACTLLSSCLAGACAAQTTLVCNDSDPCTTDACSEPGGCTFVLVPACMDAGTDASVPPSDAGADSGTDSATPSDLGVDQGAPDAWTGTPSAEGGCSCRVAASSRASGKEGSGGAALALIVLALASRRTRARAA